VRGKLDRWRALPGHERWLLVRLAVLLPAIGAALRCLGVRRTCLLLRGRVASAGAPSTVPLDAQASAERLAHLVDVASRHGPYNATCLRRSLALRWLLRRRGMPAELRIGVARADQNVRAHAWVELAGRVVNDHASVVADYAAYEDLDRHLPRRVGVLAR